MQVDLDYDQTGPDYPTYLAPDEAAETGSYTEDAEDKNQEILYENFLIADAIQSPLEPAVDSSLEPAAADAQTPLELAEDIGQASPSKEPEIR
jgi:hypothetical protein